MKDLGPIYLDTNVLIGLSEPGTAVGRLLPQIIAMQRTSHKSLFVTSRLTFSELMVKPLRDKDPMIASIYASWTVPKSWLSICEVDEPALELASLLRAKTPRLKLPDAIHLASAIVQGCPQFMTADLMLQDIPELEHPFWGRVQMEALTIIRPDEASLSALLESMSP